MLIPNQSNSISQDQINQFQRDGFLIVENFIDFESAQSVASRFERLFKGQFETTVPPDEWRWVEGRDPVDVTRMIWNAWKSDLTVARLALSEKVGEWCAQLGGWSGTRLNQDGCLWKPPGAAGLAYHQDAIYNQWIVPSDVITCWITLDDASSENGSIEYVKGSHLWGVGPKPLDFHKPEDYQAMVKQAAIEAGQDLEVIKVQVPVGGATFHHGWLWHGSGPNTSMAHRRVVALHCMQKDAEFHPTHPAYAQGRYRKFGSTTLEESFYPILWSRDGYRSEFIEGYIHGKGLEYQSHSWKKKENTSLK